MQRLHQVPASAPLPWSDKMVAMDWGYSHNAAAVWVETDAVTATPARSRMYREYVVNETIPPLFAQQVVSRSIGENVRRGVLDSAAWAQPQDGGPSPAEQMLPIFQAAGMHVAPVVKKHGPEGKRFRPHGWQLLHTYFYPHRDGGPLLTISEDCPITWRQFTTLQRAEPPKDIEDIAAGQNDDLQETRDTLAEWK